MPLRLLLSVGIAAALSGCEPTCRETCKKLLACDDPGTARDAESDCEYSCTAQQSLYQDDWKDQQKRDELGDYKSCIMDNTCADIFDGACYTDADKDLFLW